MKNIEIGQVIKGKRYLLYPPPHLYIQPGVAFQAEQRNRIADQVYPELVDKTSVVCVDIIFFCSKRKEVYLAQRVSKPMSHWWMIGGRSLIGLWPEEAAASNVLRETKLKIEENRFIYVSMRRHFFNSRQQQPQDRPCDSTCYTYALEVTQKEFEQMTGNLSQTEYAAWGLYGFNRKKLLDHNVDKSLIEIYDLLFPSLKKRFIRFLVQKLEAL